MIRITQNRNRRKGGLRETRLVANLKRSGELDPGMVAMLIIGMETPEEILLAISE